MNVFTTIYNHPGGHEIVLGDGLLTACTAEGTALSIPIGPRGLAAMGQALIDHAALLESTAAAQLQSEQDGAALGHELVQRLLELRGQPQAEAFRAVRNKLTELFMLGHIESAAGGFAAQLVHVLQVGIANLLKVECLK